MKESNDCLRMFWGNGEDKPKALKTDQLIGQFNLNGFGNGIELDDSVLARVFYPNGNHS